MTNFFSRTLGVLLLYGLFVPAATETAVNWSRFFRYGTLGLFGAGAAWIVYKKYWKKLPGNLLLPKQPLPELLKNEKQKTLVPINTPSDTVVKPDSLESLPVLPKQSLEKPVLGQPAEKPSPSFEERKKEVERLLGEVANLPFPDNGHEEEKFRGSEWVIEEVKKAFQPFLKQMSTYFKGLEAAEKYALLKIKHKKTTILECILIANNLQIAKLLFEGLSPEQKSELIKIPDDIAFDDDDEEDIFFSLDRILSGDDLKMTKLLLEGFSVEQKCNLFRRKNVVTTDNEIFESWGSYLSNVIRENKIEMVKLLLDGFTTDQKYKILNNDSEPLHVATVNWEINWNKHEIVALLLKDLSADQKYTLLINHNDITNAIYTNDYAMVELLLAGLSIEQKYAIEMDEENKPAITWASIKNNHKMAKLLLEGLSAEQKLSLIFRREEFCKSPLALDIIKMIIEPLRVQKIHFYEPINCPNCFKAQVNGCKPRELLKLLGLKGGNNQQTLLEQAKTAHNQEIVGYLTQIEQEAQEQVAKEKQLPVLPPKSDVVFEFPGE